LDNDGDRDIFIACGHLDDHAPHYDQTATYESPNIALENIGNGRFVNVSDQCGDVTAVVLSSRGAAFDDLDNDGDIDVIVLNSRREPTLLRNDSRPGNHCIDVQLQGTKSNRDGVGARVEVVAGDLTQVAEVHSGRGYQSHFGTRLHFGLGKRNRVDRIQVKWPGAGAQTHENVPADRIVSIKQK
jgi:hypothetical protein